MGAVLQALENGVCSSGRLLVCHGGHRHGGRLYGNGHHDVSRRFGGEESVVVRTWLVYSGRREKYYYLT